MASNNSDSEEKEWKKHGRKRAGVQEEVDSSDTELTSDSPAHPFDQSSSSLLDSSSDDDGDARFLAADPVEGSSRTVTQSSSMKRTRTYISSTESTEAKDTDFTAPEDAESGEIPTDCLRNGLNSILPVEVLTIIFHFLPVEDKRAAAAVCRLWMFIMRGRSFQEKYQYRISRDFHEPFTPMELMLLQPSRNLVLFHKSDESLDRPDAQFRAYNEQLAIQQLVSRMGQQATTDCASEYPSERAKFAKARSFVYSKKQSKKRHIVRSPDATISDLLYNRKLQITSLSLANLDLDTVRAIIGEKLNQLELLVELDLVISFTGYKLLPNQPSDERNRLDVRSDSLRSFTMVGNVYFIAYVNFETPKLQSFHAFVGLATMDVIEKYLPQLTTVQVSIKKQRVLDRFLRTSFAATTSLDVFAYIEPPDPSPQLIRNFFEPMKKLDRFAINHIEFFTATFPTACEMLTHITKLELSNITSEYSMFEHITKLTALKQLILYDCVPEPETNAYMELPQLEWLTVRCPEGIMIRHIRSTGVRRLDVQNTLQRDVKGNKCDISAEVVSDFCHFPNVRELLLEQFFLPGRVWDVCPQMSTVQQVTIKECGFYNADEVTAYKERFPSLQRLFVDDCEVAEQPEEGGAIEEESFWQRMNEVFTDASCTGMFL